MTVEIQNKKRKLDGKIFSFLSFNLNLEISTVVSLN